MMHAGIEDFIVNRIMYLYTQHWVKHMNLKILRKYVNVYIQTMVKAFRLAGTALPNGNIDRYM